MQARIAILDWCAAYETYRKVSPEWLTAGQIDETYSRLLPSRKSEITADEIAELASIFRCGRGDGSRAFELDGTRVG